MDLIYDSNHTFYKYHNIKKIGNVSLKLKYSFLAKFFDDKYIRVKIQKEKRERKKFVS